MKKNKFLKMTMLLIIGGFITKILGMLIKIVMTRFIGTEGIGIYMLIMPTFSLLVSLTQFGFPVAISKLVAEDRFNNKKLVFGIIPISLGICFIILLVLLSSGQFIATELLKEERTYLGLMSIGFILPFIAISSILRAYFFGKERMFPHVISNILEDVIRLVLIILFVPSILKMGLSYVVAFLILISIFSELSSIIIFLICLPNKISLKKEDFKPKKDYLKTVLSISIPTTGSRIIGSIGYFLEPIILAYTFKQCGYSNNFMITEYGILNGYVLPLLLLPSFFTMAISQALIPIISKTYTQHNLKETKRKIKQAIFYSLVVGIPCTLLFMLIPEIPLRLIYNTTEGISYIKILAPICLLYYIQSPLNGTLQAMGKAKEAMKGTLLGMIFRTAFLFVFSLLHIGMWGLVIAVSTNIIIVTIHQMKKVNEALK
jgi:stage V sporulation protein B